MKFILASQSSGRKKILERTDIDFIVIPSSIDEAAYPEKDPALRAVSLARMKAHDVASAYPDAFVLGADSLVVAADGTMLEKPLEETAARQMIMQQSNTRSTVFTAMCLVVPAGQNAGQFTEIFPNKTENRHIKRTTVQHKGKSDGRTYIEGVDTADVYFRNITPDRLETWIASEKWRGCAGGFQIEEDQCKLIHRIDGERTAVIGLSLPLLQELMNQALNINQTV